MKEYQKFFIPKGADPFTILKLFQTLRAMEYGDHLELFVEGTEISDQFRKILSVESCEMSKTQFRKNINQCVVEITKKMLPGDSGEAKGDCCCGKKNTL